MEELEPEIFFGGLLIIQGHFVFLNRPMIQLMNCKTEFVYNYSAIYTLA